MKTNIEDIICNKKLTEDIFKNVPKELKVNFVCVDFDGTVKFGFKQSKDTVIKLTLAQERWKGLDWLYKIKNTAYKPLTFLEK